MSNQNRTKVTGIHNAIVSIGAVEGGINNKVTNVNSDSSSITNTEKSSATEHASLILAKGVSKEVVEKLVVIHHRYLEQLYLQEAELGLNCPPHIKLEIEDREEAIRLLQKSTG